MVRDMCTSVVVGKGATIDGTIILSRNEDFKQGDKLIYNKNKYMVFRKHPGYYNEKGEYWTLGNGLQVPVPKEQYSYNAMPDADADDEAKYAIGKLFFFEERGINEHNVAISATNSIEINDNANKADPLLSSGGIEESIIVTLILPQVTTAKEAVEILGGYVEKYGASEGNGILIGDPQESWYFEIGSGHHWIAVKVPQDSYIVVANGMRVHSVNLDDEENVLSSNNLFNFVCTHNLLTDADRNNFNFAKAFGKIGNPYNVDRVWLAQKILTPSLDQPTGLCQYPLFLEPDKKIDVRNIMKVLRATYKGTELQNSANRPIGVGYTAESHIMVFDPGMPKELMGLIWQVVSTPMGAPYMPLYSVMDEHDIPVGFSLGGNQYNPLSAYWSFRGLYSLSRVNNYKYKHIVDDKWKEYEEQIFLENEAFKKMLKSMYKDNHKAAINSARKYSSGIAYQTVRIANHLRDQIMTEITKDTVEG